MTTVLGPPKKMRDAEGTAAPRFTTATATPPSAAAADAVSPSPAPQPPSTSRDGAAVLPTDAIRAGADAATPPDWKKCPPPPPAMPHPSLAREATLMGALAAPELGETAGDIAGSSCGRRAGRTWASVLPEIGESKPIRSEVGTPCRWSTGATARYAPPPC